MVEPFMMSVPSAVLYSWHILLRTVDFLVFSGISYCEFTSVCENLYTYTFRDLKHDNHEIKLRKSQICPNLLN